MKLIPLSQGLFAKVDDEDFDRINEFKWCAKKGGNNFYATRKIYLGFKKRGFIRMHRIILNAQPGTEIDHIDGDTLNNQKQNLRFCSRSENCMNIKPRKNHSSKYKGVSKLRSGKWVANIRVNGKLMNLGSYKVEEQAAEAYNQHAKEYFGSFARLNEISV